MDPNDRLLTMADLRKVVPFSKVTIYQMIREGRFPRQVPLGPNKVAWLRSEVLDWIEARRRERDVVAEAA